MSVDWCAEQLVKLEIKDNRLDTLKEIRVQLKNSNTAPYSKLLALLDSIDDCGDSHEQLIVTCDILRICMSNLEISSIEWCYFTYLERCLQHRNDNIKLLALNDIKRRINDHLKESAAASNSHLYRTQTLLEIISCLGNSDEKNGILSTGILWQLLPTVTEDKPIKMRLVQTLEKPVLTRCGVYLLGVMLSIKSPAIHDKYDFILDRLIDDLDSEDILLRGTALAFASDVSLTKYGYMYLENKGIIEKVLQEIGRLEENPFKSMLTPVYLKFFGCIATVQPANIIRGYPEMFHALFKCLTDEEPSILTVAYDTLAQVANSFDGKLLLGRLYAEKMVETFEGIGRSIRNLPLSIKIHALESLEKVFQCDANNVKDTLIEFNTDLWFHGLNASNDLEFIHNFCKSPLSKIKLAALRLLRAVVKYQWGQMALSRTAGFIEYLLNRQAEFANPKINKAVLHEKFAVLSSLVASTLLDATSSEQIRQYVQDNGNAS